MLARLRLISLIVATLGLLGSLAVAIPASAEDTAPPASPTPTAADSDDDGTLDAPDTAAATAAAAAGDEPVEDMSQRTEMVSVVVNPDGTFTSKEFATPVRIEQDGEWVDVDYTLVKQSDGSWAPKASPVEVSIDGGSAKEAARVTFDDGESLAVTWPEELPDPTVEGGVASYELSEATDLVVAVTSRGLNARIRLNKRPSENDPVFTLGLRAEGVDLDQTNTGGLEISDDAGRTIATTSTLTAWDADTDYAGDPANVVDLEADLDQTSSHGDVTQHTLDLTTPEGFLSNPDTEWPVTIDPDISMSKVRDTWVRNGDTASHGAENRLIVGKIDPSVSSNSSPARSYLKFYNGTLEANPDIQVISADLGLWQYYGYSCAARRMRVYPITETWNDTITYANRPSIVTSPSAYVDANRGATGCADGWTTVNVTNIAKAWASGSVDMQGVRLHADDEEFSSYERRFCSMNVESGTSCNTATRTPYFSVTYNTTPNAPTIPTAVVEGSLVRLSAQVSDVDGESVRARFQVKRGAQTVFEGYSNFIEDGEPAKMTLPLLQDGNYSVRAWTHDGYALSSTSSAAASFVINTVAPSGDDLRHTIAPVAITDASPGVPAATSPLAPNEIRQFQVGGAGGIPADGSLHAVGLKLTARGWSSSGRLEPFNTDADVPSVRDAMTLVGSDSTPSTGLSQTIITEVSEDGQISIKNSTPSPVSVSLQVADWYTTPVLYGGAASELPPPGTPEGECVALANEQNVEQWSCLGAELYSTDSDGETVLVDVAEGWEDQVSTGPTPVGSDGEPTSAAAVNFDTWCEPTGICKHVTDEYRGYTKGNFVYGVIKPSGFEKIGSLDVILRVRLNGSQAQFQGRFEWDSGPKVTFTETEVRQLRYSNKDEVWSDWVDGPNGNGSFAISSSDVSDTGPWLYADRQKTSYQYIGQIKGKYDTSKTSKRNFTSLLGNSFTCHGSDGCLMDDPSK